MAEWLKAAVLKTVEGNTSGGSNPSLPATQSILKSTKFPRILSNPIKAICGIIIAKAIHAESSLRGFEKAKATHESI